MDLSNLKPNVGSVKNRKRIARGEGSGQGDTAGRGHKGQKSRSGGFHKAGFEGGQMPLQRRLPKFGFTSRFGKNVDEIRLHELNGIDSDIIDIEVLRKAGLISKNIKRVKLIARGEIEKPITVKGLSVTKGALRQIESAGGSVEV